jgi:hypothetical protein
MATITETSEATKTVETASAPVIQSSPLADRKKHEFRLRMVYCEYLPTDFCDKLRTVPVPYSEILNIDGNASTFVQDWFPSVILPRIWTVVTNFFRCWEIDESTIESLKEPFVDRPSNEIMKAIRNCLLITEPGNPTEPLYPGPLKELIKWAHSTETPLTINVAFTGALHSVIRNALESSPSLWREIYPARIDSGADMHTIHPRCDQSE